MYDADPSPESSARAPTRSEATGLRGRAWDTMLYNLIIAILPLGAMAYVIAAGLTLVWGEEPWEDPCTFARKPREPRKYPTDGGGAAPPRRTELAGIDPAYTFS